MVGRTTKMIRLEVWNHVTSLGHMSQKRYILCKSKTSNQNFTQKRSLYTTYLMSKLTIFFAVIAQFWWLGTRYIYSFGISGQKLIKSA